MDSFPASSSSQSGAAAQRRALIRHYKDNPPPMGVYAVRCDAAGLLCVNASMNLPGALNRERFQLRMGGHPDRRVQQAWRAHGEAGLRIEVLDTLKPRAGATDADYRAELAALCALWQEELAA